jgi:hypothetical protein
VRPRPGAEFNHVGAVDAGRRQQSRRQFDAAWTKDSLAQASEQPVPGNVGIRALREWKVVLVLHCFFPLTVVGMRLPRKISVNSPALIRQCGATPARRLTGGVKHAINRASVT